MKVSDWISIAGVSAGLVGKQETNTNWNPKVIFVYFFSSLFLQ
jgi:hypothetical protein